MYGKNGLKTCLQYLKNWKVIFKTMNNTLSLIGRTTPLFDQDLSAWERELTDIISQSSFLVIGAAGSIGQAVSKEIFRRKPKLLHVVDISENNMVELVRDIRSSLGYIDGEFSTFALDIGSAVYDAFINAAPSYDYVLNLSALKHVRSEKDAFTLMRMVEVNILNTEKTLLQAREKGSKKYFCVSSDKAANPVNMMGASKRIMEAFLMRRSLELPVSTARFANVAFSDGSLLYGFKRRIEKNQPLSAPNDIRRYFVTPRESGQLCLASCILGENRDVFFPKLDEELNLITFSQIAERYLENLGYEPVICSSEDEARARVNELKPKRKYPVYFFKSDTTGEKDYEEFYTQDETLDMERFKSIGIIKNTPNFDKSKLEYFETQIQSMLKRKHWTRQELIDLFNHMLPEFQHKETGKFLDKRM